MGLRRTAAARGLGGLACLACVAALLALAGCGRKPEASPAAEASPPGTIRELDGEASVTTDVNARAPAFARTGIADRTFYYKRLAETARTFP